MVVDIGISFFLSFLAGDLEVARSIDTGVAVRLNVAKMAIGHVYSSKISPVQKIFHENVKIGFVAHAQKFQAALDQGQVLAPAKSLDQMRRIVFNDYVDAALAGFFMVVVLTNPDSRISVIASMIPFATPMLMTMRMAMSTPPPTWQIVLSIALTVVTAIACVAASAKIFRIGLLMHGKAPSFREMAKWVVTR